MLREFLFSFWIAGHAPLFDSSAGSIPFVLVIWMRVGETESGRSAASVQKRHPVSQNHHVLSCGFFTKNSYPVALCDSSGEVQPRCIHTRLVLPNTNKICVFHISFTTWSSRMLLITLTPTTGYRNIADVVATTPTDTFF